MGEGSSGVGQILEWRLTLLQGCYTQQGYTPTVYFRDLHGGEGGGLEVGLKKMVTNFVQSIKLVLDF